MSNHVNKFIRGSVWACSGFPHIYVEGVQAGNRIAIVISDNKGNMTNKSVVVLPLTRQLKKKIAVNVEFVDDNNIKQTVLCNQPLTVSKESLSNFRYIVSSQVMDSIDSAFALAHGIRNSAVTLDIIEDVIEKIMDKHVTPVVKSPMAEVTEDMVLEIASKLESLFMKLPNVDGMNGSAPVLNAVVNGDVVKKELVKEKVEEREVEDILRANRFLKKPNGDVVKQKERKVRHNNDKWDLDTAINFLKDKKAAGTNAEAKNAVWYKYDIKNGAIASQTSISLRKKYGLDKDGNLVDMNKALSLNDVSDDVIQEKEKDVAM